MLDVHDFGPGRGLQMMEQTSWGSHYERYTASNPAGPWTQLERGRIDDRCHVPYPHPPPPAQGEPGPPGPWCYNLYAHPELSTSTQLMYSYYWNDDTDDADRNAFIRVVDIDPSP